MSLLRTLHAKLPAPVAAVLRSIRAYARNAISQRRYRFAYSRAFYEEGYHELLADQCGTTVEFWEQHGYRARLMEVCDELERHIDLTACRACLEVACMYGKTAFWLGERYPRLRVWAFDFSRRFVAATQAANPLGDRLTVWQSDATDIHLDGERFDGFFDIITCLDVTEHLPDDVYQRMLAELARVARAGGYLLLMQGNTVQMEHIHVLPEAELIRDAERHGFQHLVTVAHRHHLFVRRDGSQPS